MSPQLTLPVSSYFEPVKRRIWVILPESSTGSPPLIISGLSRVTSSPPKTGVSYLAVCRGRFGRRRRTDRFFRFSRGKTMLNPHKTASIPTSRAAAPAIPAPPCFHRRLLSRSKRLRLRTVKIFFHEDVVSRLLFRRLCVIEPSSASLREPHRHIEETDEVSVKPP